MIQYLSILLNAQRAKMDERGATAVEYGLLVALIAAVIVAVVVTLGGQIQAGFQTVSDAITGGGGEEAPAT